MLAQNTPAQSKIIKSVSSKSKDKKEKDFIEHLLSETSADDLSVVDKDHLYKSAQSTFKLFSKHAPKSFQVEVYKDSPNAEIAVLEVVCDDIPFIIDSISNELKQQVCDIHLILHPTLPVLRDSKNNFVKFDVNAPKESIIQYHISSWVNEKHLDNLKNRIIKILECVSYAVYDWRGMLSKMNDGIQSHRDCIALRENEMRDESIAFLEWLSNNNIVFLGYYYAEISKKKVIPKNKSFMGIVKSDLYVIEEADIDEQYLNKDPIFIRKWDARSVVHRTAHMDLIIVKEFDARGEVIGAHHFFGLFTSTVYYQSVRNIPLMRKKVGQVIKKYGYPESSHNCKELITAMESFPRGELLKMTVDELYETATGIVSLSLIPRVKLFLRKDAAGKFISCIIFIPERRFSTETRIVIEDIICRHLNGVVSKRYVQVGESALTRLQLIIKANVEDVSKINIKQIEKSIISAVSIWSDELQESLKKYFGLPEAKKLYNKYKDAFDIKYRTSFRGSQAVHDINVLEKSFNEDRVLFDIYSSSKEDSRQHIQLKIYSVGFDLPLSATLPIIENLGLYAIDEITYEITLADENGDVKNGYIHRYRLTSKFGDFNITDEVRNNIVTTLEKVWEKQLDDDKFNSLLSFTKANWREAAMLRSYSKYLKQTTFPHTPEYILETLINNAAITNKLIVLFDLKFNPKIKRDNKKVELLIKEINKDLTDIKSITEDKTIRSLLQVILATQRTNFYQLDNNGKPKDCISFKIKSKEVHDLPFPRPHAEIFVYSARFEAIHLRGGMVARGGLRWSDRSEDYRTEVLGLMKAQMTKNAVIVPVGSKGGFYVKQATIQNSGREAYFAEGVDCYKLFLSSMLDITDNVVAGKIVAPKDVVRIDGDDPYLVVAADKGTATFSDYANAVSESYDFWLGDAFASGGSAGYDHKKMGITAKGAWISVVRHFEEMGRDINTEEFTAVGIGDMAGDVFGNGMLLSDNMKLIAAFNHMHIFIDPNPDTKVSFKERNRLFKMPRSSWTDYNEKLISKGGGIFERKQKSISISAEAREVLGIKETSLSPDELIKCIIKAPVDLLWNGGIGTYVKARTQTNAQIGDKSNDALRVDGSELRCHIIGEGGNLGMTQLGRIEFAKIGGRVNTDFIDNSAGVDCSDHEVNIKIGLSDLLRNKKLKRADRDKFLNKMTEEVGELVIKDNYKQTQIVSIEQNSLNRIGTHTWLINHLESLGELDREIEFLPDENDLSVLIAEKLSLTRPEISVLVAYSKNSAYSKLCKYNLDDGKLITNYLNNYFPSDFIKKYSKEILKHKLKNEIVATVLVNDFINMMGCTLFHQIMDELIVSPDIIIKAFIVVKEIFDIDNYWMQIEKLPASVHISLKINLFNTIQAFVERNIYWMIRNQVDFSNLDKLVSSYKSEFVVLLKNFNSILSESMNEDYQENLLMYKDTPAHKIADAVIKIRMLKPACDIIFLSKKSGKKITECAQVYFKVTDHMHITWLIIQARTYVAKRFYQGTAIRALIAQLQNMGIQITLQELKAAKESKNSVFEQKNDLFLRYDSFINSLKGTDVSEGLIAMLTIAIQRINDFAA